MEKLCEVLKPFKVATSQSSGELYPTLRSVYPLIHGILENHGMPKDVDAPEILFFKEKQQERYMRGLWLEMYINVMTSLHQLCIHATRS